MYFLPWQNYTSFFCFGAQKCKAFDEIGCISCWNNHKNLIDIFFIMKWANKSWLRYNITKPVFDSSYICIKILAKNVYVIVELPNFVLILRSSMLLSFLTDMLMFYEKKYSQVPTNATFLMMKNNIETEECSFFPTHGCTILFT